MIKSNLRELLERANDAGPNDKQRAIAAAHQAFNQQFGFDTFLEFAAVLEQNVVPSAFRNEVLPILLESARYGFVAVAMRARDRAMVRTVLDYDWSDTDAIEAEPLTQLEARSQAAIERYRIIAMLEREGQPVAASLVRVSGAL